MEKLRERLVELFRICVYIFAVFGLIMFIAYILCINTPEFDHIPMNAIRQTIQYSIGLFIVIVLWLSDIVFEKLTQTARVILASCSIYIMGIIYFQYNAPNGPLDGIRYFVGFSIWILYMSGIIFTIWIAYRGYVNQKYNNCLKQYKKSLNTYENVNGD